MQSLLDDLDELGSDGEGPLDDDEDFEKDDGGGVGGPLAGSKRARLEGGGVSAADLDALSDEDDDDLAAAAAGGAALELPVDSELESQLSKLRGRAGFRSVAHLRETARFRDHMARIAASTSAGTAAATAGHLEDQPDYRLVVASNQVISTLEDELAALHRYIADAYAPKFPELVNLVPSAPEFVRVCQAVQVWGRGCSREEGTFGARILPFPSPTRHAE